MAGELHLIIALVRDSQYECVCVCLPAIALKTTIMHFCGLAVWSTIKATSLVVADQIATANAIATNQPTSQPLALQFWQKLRFA